MDNTNIYSLTKYKTTEDKFDSLFTIIIYDLTIEEVVNKLKLHCNKCKNIGNQFRRQYVIDRVSKLIEKLKEEVVEAKSKVNRILLVSDSINQIDLTQEQINVLKEYQCEKYVFIYDNYFHIDYLTDLLTNFNFVDAIQVMNKEIVHLLINKTKSKQKKKTKMQTQKDLIDYIKQNVTSNCIIHGNSFLLKDLHIDHHIIVNKLLASDNLLELHNRTLMKVAHDGLIECFDALANEKTMHLIIYGEDEVRQRITNFEIKKLFCHVDVIETLKKTIDPTCFNFELVEIYSLQNGDIASKLLNDYKGLIGFSYY